MSDAVLDQNAATGRAGASGEAAAAADINWTKVFLGFSGMVLGQFMALLDIQIVASSLSQIQAGVGASADEVSWVQTIYLLAEVVIIPLTAYLTKMWGTRPFYLAAAAAFMLTSVATGLSTSFEMMIVFRALQGLAAGAMIPAVFATAMTVFPPERRMTANIVIGLIVGLAPAIGPTLGGHLTDVLSWRWLFFINIPPGLLVIFLVGRYGGFDKGDPRLARGIDWTGTAMMTIFLLSAQYVLEEGAGKSWFQDDLILWLTVLAAITGVIFIWRQLTYRQPIVSLRPFGDRNFTLGVIMVFVGGISMFGGTFILPLFLANILRYSPGQVGTTMVIGGLSTFLAAPLVGRLLHLVDLRLAMVIGFGVAAYGIGMGARLNTNWGFWDFALMQAVRGVGIILALIASQQLSVSTLPVSQMKDASGLVNLIRNLGGAIGVAILSTLLTHQTAVHLGDLTALVNSGDLASQGMVNGLVGRMLETGNPDPEGAANKVFSMILRRNAEVLAYADAFVFLAAGSLLSAILALLAKPGSSQNRPPEAAGGH